MIWRQGFYPGIGAPSWTADYGNETANHFDHVHIATDGGGYPTGRKPTHRIDESRNERLTDRPATRGEGGGPTGSGVVRVVRAPAVCP